MMNSAKLNPAQPETLFICPLTLVDRSIINRFQPYYLILDKITMGKKIMVFNFHLLIICFLMVTWNAHNIITIWCENLLMGISSVIISYLGLLWTI